MRQTLVLEIPPSALAPIRRAELQIVLAFAGGDVCDDAAGAAPLLVWQSLDALELTTVSWRDGGWGLYAATVAAAAGQRIVAVARLAAAPAGFAYELTADALFTGPFEDARLPAADRAVRNAMPFAAYPLLTLGLSLAATINGAAAAAQPASARVVLATRQERLTPPARLYVWLGRGLGGGAVLATPGDGAARVELAGAEPTTLIYDPALGRFVPRPPLPPGLPRGEDP